MSSKVTEKTEYTLKLEGNDSVIAAMLPTVPFTDLERARKFKYGILIAFPTVKIGIYKRSIIEERIDD